MNVVVNSKKNHPVLIMSGLMKVNLYGNYFTENTILKVSGPAINIYVVYKLNPIRTTRNTDYNIQNALFGAMKITKNSDSSKNNYRGYGLCFDEGGEFSHTVKQGNFNRTTDAKNVIIFGVDMSFSVHATNRANNIYVMGKNFIQGINDTTIYAEKLFHNNFTEFGVKFVLSLHYNGDNSYLFANGREELKFKAKDDQLITEKLCLGNLSSEWTTGESEKTRLYENIYNVLVNNGSGSCNTFNNPMAKLCVPNVIKRRNMQVYNFLMRLNETRNVLWHESCKCVCKVNSSVCNSKQIWNSDTCRCDCTEDFAGIINCTRGYTWNPSACECQRDMWGKPGQYLNRKNCVFKNKLIGRLIEECTSIINETMINNKDSGNNNTLWNVFIGLFSVLLLVGVVCFCVFAYFKWFKGKKVFKKYINY